MLLARVLRTIREHALVAPGDRVLVGVSGGPDSLALLHALALARGELSIELAAATVDHGLRPESAAEHARVREHVHASGLGCEVLAIALPSGAALQARARAARYAALSAHAAAIGARVVAVAHTRDDQAETVLARLLRGSGVRGLAAALRRRDDGVVRPLLDCSRAEVLAFLSHRGIEPIVLDPTNADARFLRARVRHEHLPRLVAEQPELASILAQLADDAQEHRAMVERLADERGARDGRALDRASLAAEHAPIRRERLRRWARVHAGTEIGRAHLEALERLCLTARGEARLPGGLVVAIDRGSLCLSAPRRSEDAEDLAPTPDQDTPDEDSNDGIEEA